MRKLLILGAVASAALWLAASPASAGGWAITSLDEVPAPVAGEEVRVGFTILQHGVSPVNPEGGGVAVVVRPEGGEALRFDARQDGPTGHYVAGVTFPTGGAFTWNVEQGWFGSFELGSIEVARPRGSSPSTAVERQDQGALRIVLPLVVLAGLALVAVDLHARRTGLAAG